MKDEIKEKIKAYYIGDDIDKVLDYITNLKQIEQDHQRINGELREENKKLQEEIETLKENAIHNDKVVDKAKWNEMLYKSRNEKARNHIMAYYYTDLYDDTLTAFEDELLNILQGDDKDVKD